MSCFSSRSKRRGIEPTEIELEGKFHLVSDEEILTPDDDESAAIQELIDAGEPADEHYAQALRPTSCHKEHGCVSAA